MAEPFLSEIRLFSFGFPPKDWARCDGQLLPINQNQALFSLLGTTFGGNGQTTFGLPDLRGRVPIHEGHGHTLGERAGEQSHVLSIAELPAHTHVMKAYAGPADGGAAALGAGPTAALAQPFAVQAGGATAPVNRFSTGTPDTALAAAAVSQIGGSQAHENMQPHLALNYCIALAGIFPSPN